jgi:hypothetical protein
MGWKSTVTIRKEEAQQLLIARILSATDTQLEDALSSLGFGDDMNLAYYGRNFQIGEPETNEEDED